MAHAVDRALEDRHVPAQAERDHRGVVADDPAADTSTFPGETPATPASRSPRPPSGFSRKYAPAWDGEPAGDLAHRREQRQRAGGGLDGLVRDAGGTAVDEGVGQLLARGQVQVREEDEVVAEQRVLGGKWLLDLEDELRSCPDLGGGGEPGADRLVRGVGERAPLARPALDENLVAVADELPCARGCERDPVLVGLDLGDDADLHGRPDSTCGRRAAGRAARPRTRPRRTPGPRPGRGPCGSSGSPAHAAPSPSPSFSSATATSPRHEPEDRLACGGSARDGAPRIGVGDAGDDDRPAAERRRRVRGGGGRETRRARTSRRCRRSRARSRRRRRRSPALRTCASADHAVTLSTSPPKHGPTETVRPISPRSLRTRTVSDSASGRAPPGELDVRDAQRDASAAQTGATWLCSEQQTTGMPPSTESSSPSVSSTCRAAACTGV